MLFFAGRHLYFQTVLPKKRNYDTHGRALNAPLIHTFRYNDLLAEHAQAVFEVGEETGVPVIDLHKYAVDLIKKNGKEASRVYFHPGDMTHTNEYGSFLFAHLIARE